MMPAIWRRHVHRMRNGVSVDYSYDAPNRLSTVKDNNIIALNDGVTSYAYDSVGNLENYQYRMASRPATPTRLRQAAIARLLKEVSTLFQGQLH